MKSRSRILVSAAAFTLVMVQAASAGEAHVIAASAVQSSNGSWRIDATVRHDDTGWDHYANQFEVLTLDGHSLGTRILHHPHVEEQPFTRSLSGVEIHEDISIIRVRAGDSVHEFGGEEIQIELSR